MFEKNLPSLTQQAYVSMLKVIYSIRKITSGIRRIRSIFPLDFTYFIMKELFNIYISLNFDLKLNNFKLGETYSAKTLIRSKVILRKP